MSFFNNVYAEFVEKLKKKETNTKLQYIRSPKILIHGCALFEDFDSWAKLCKLNEIFQKHRNIDNYQKFILTEVISAKKCCISTFIFSSIIKCGNMF